MPDLFNPIFPGTNPAGQAITISKTSVVDARHPVRRTDSRQASPGEEAAPIAGLAPRPVVEALGHRVFHHVFNLKLMLASHGPGREIALILFLINTLELMIGFPSGPS